MISTKLAILTILQYILSFTGAWFWEQTSKRFLSVRPGIFPYAARLFFFSIGMTGPMWIGDENLLFFFPMFLFLFLQCYQGTRSARISVGITFYLLLAGLGMIVDSTYNLLPNNTWNLSDTLSICFKLGTAVFVFFLAQKLNPRKHALELPGRLWGLCILLSLAPLFTILSFSVWNGFGRNQMDISQYRIAYTILPFVLLSALAILAAMILLSKQQELEQISRLSSMRETYYENLKRGERQKIKPFSFGHGQTGECLCCE
ncbi:MAG: hypothetical protein Q4B70_09135 [Lachnospiraceae bacterium]|nr:hypothetical protein [Lachnospiraceae bacterium]